LCLEGYQVIETGGNGPDGDVGMVLTEGCNGMDALFQSSRNVRN
jgi:hypothetical protein